MQDESMFYRDDRYVSVDNTGSVLKNNQDRRELWQLLSTHHRDELQKALDRIDPRCAQTLRWHYEQQKSFKEITCLMNRSISMVRHYHNRGMFELQQYVTTQ